MAKNKPPFPAGLKKVVNQILKRRDRSESKTKWRNQLTKRRTAPAWAPNRIRISITVHPDVLECMDLLCKANRLYRSDVLETLVLEAGFELAQDNKATINVYK